MGATSYRARQKWLVGVWWSFFLLDIQKVQTSPYQQQAIFCGPPIARKYGVSQSLQRAALHTSNVESVDSKLKVTCWVGVKADQDNLQCAPITIENGSQSMFIIERVCSCEASSRSSDISYQSQTLYLTILYPSLLYRSLLALAHNIALHNLIAKVNLDDQCSKC